jgi:hypothetical protein
MKLDCHPRLLSCDKIGKKKKKKKKTMDPFSETEISQVV